MDPILETKPTFRLLFVCTGNTCRSPMAEVIAKRAIAELGWDHVEVRSAGIAAVSGAPASAGAVRAASRSGLDLTDHASTHLTAALAGSADLILTMSAGHVLRLVELGAGERATLLPAFAAGIPGPAIPEAVSDPIGGPDEEYFKTFELLDQLIDRSLRRLAPTVSR